MKCRISEYTELMRPTNKQKTVVLLLKGTLWTLGRYRARLLSKTWKNNQRICWEEGGWGILSPFFLNPSSFHSHFTLPSWKNNTQTPEAVQIQIREQVSSQIRRFSGVCGTNSPVSPGCAGCVTDRAEKGQSTGAIRAEHRIGLWDREISHHRPIFRLLLYKAGGLNAFFKVSLFILSTWKNAIWWGRRLGWPLDRPQETLF